MYMYVQYVYTSGVDVYTKCTHRWPAVVSPDPWNDGAEAHVCEEKEGRIYHIEFLGRGHTHSWLVEDKVIKRTTTSDH